MSITEKLYGMDALYGDGFLRHRISTISYFKPLGSVGGGLDSGPLSSMDPMKCLPFPVTESLSGTTIESSAASPVTTHFTGDDIGYETRIAGKTRVSISALWYLWRGEYYRHLGYNQYVANGLAKPFAYTSVDLLFGGSLKLNSSRWGAFRPISALLGPERFRAGRGRRRRDAVHVEHLALAHRFRLFGI